MDDVKEGLQYAFQTRNPLTLAASGAGHAAMEATMSNLVEPGDVVLVATSGLWGERFAEMGRRQGKASSITCYAITKSCNLHKTLKDILCQITRSHPLFRFSCSMYTTFSFALCPCLSKICDYWVDLMLRRRRASSVEPVRDSLLFGAVRFGPGERAPQPALRHPRGVHLRMRPGAGGAGRTVQTVTYPALRMEQLNSINRPLS